MSIEELQRDWEPQAAGVFSGVEVVVDPRLPRDCIVIVTLTEKRVFQFEPDAQNPTALVEVPDAHGL